MRRVLLILLLSLTTVALNAQDVVRGDVRRGNNHFRKDKYKEADIDYRKALVKDSTSFAANYNLANTLYKLSSKDAMSYYDKVKDAAVQSGHGADYYFNVGDCALAEKNYQAAVDAFKQSLLLNPGDVDAKENYLYAKQLLEDQKNNQNQNQNQNQNNNQNNQNQNQDQNKDKNNDNQDQNKDNQDQNQNQNQDQNQDRPDQGQPQMNKQTAQQMLQAIQAKEKETQDKVKKEKAAVFKSKQKEKNW